MRTYLGALRQLFRGKGLSREIFGFSKSSLFFWEPSQARRIFLCEIRIAKYALRNSHCAVRTRKFTADTALHISVACSKKKRKKF